MKEDNIEENIDDDKYISEINVLFGIRSRQILYL